MGNTRRGRIPDDLGWLIDELDSLSTRLKTLEAPDGVQRNDTIAYLLSLVGYADTVENHSITPVPHDELWHWGAVPDLEIANFDIPTRSVMLSATAGGCQLSPGGAIAVGTIAMVLYDANGVALAETPTPTAAGGVPGLRSAQLTSAAVISVSISTGQFVVTIADPVANPGPYTLKGWAGAWSDNAATATTSVFFSDLTIRAEIVGGPDSP